MLKAYRYRIYPTEEQKVLLAKHFGCHRWVYNWGLKRKTEAYKLDKKSISRFDLQAELPVLKKQEETKWLAEVNAQSLQISLDHLDKAFVRFFREKKGFPKFKNRHGNQSFQCFSNVKIDQENGLLRLPKFDDIEVVISQIFEGRTKTTTITKTVTDKYFVSLLVETDLKIPELKKVDPNTSIGIDTGIKTFLTLSDGRSYENVKRLKDNLIRLKVLQKRLSGKKKGSNRRKVAKLKVAKLHEKIRNQRLDYIHKITHQLANDNQVSAYCIEDLNVKGMTQNHNLAQALNDVSLGKFYEILGYKCAWNGINILTIGRFEPSSKTCCICGSIKKDLTLADRTFKCDNCNNEIDRDLQAAINIRDFALHPQNNTRQGVPGERIESRQ